jgi:hypothetical protein
MMQVSVRKQLSRGLQFSGNYTYSHSIDSGSTWQSVGTTVNGPAGGDGLTTDQTQPDLDRGNSVFDIRHRLTFTYVWELPFFRNNHGMLAALIGGWGWNGIWSLQSGAHWSPFDDRPPSLKGDCSAPVPVNCVNEGGDYNLDGESNDRPNATASNVHGTSNGSTALAPTNFFSVRVWGAWKLSAQYVCGSRLLRSILSDIRVSERLHLQFRAEAFNVFNHTNFLLGNNTSLHDPLFGSAGGTNPPRNLQFGLKVSF